VAACTAARSAAEATVLLNEALLARGLV